jgi:hypothetical protein
VNGERRFHKSARSTGLAGSCPAPASFHPSHGLQFCYTSAEEAKMAQRSTAKTELIDTGKNKMYAKRDARGQFKEMDDVGRSLSADRRSKAKTTTGSGYGDQGDHRR